VDDLSPRHRALAIARFLRINNLTGIASDLQYRDLQNNYIGIALQDPDHPSLPLVSVAIFSSLAQRLGLNAHCCGFPSHVHAIVYPSQGQNMDGVPVVTEEDSQPMYLDPFRSEAEVPISHLQTQLTAWGISPSQFTRYLERTDNSNIILRTSRNILATINQFRGLDRNTDNTGHPTIRLHANPFVDMDNAFYSALWANFLLFSPVTGRPNPADQVQFIPMILERFERLYPMDAILIEQYVCPQTSLGVETGVWERELCETLRVVRAGDAMPRQVRWRDSFSTREKVKHKVGQIFRHKRYGYTAVITGWDVECSMTSEWMQNNGIDSLDRGRHQSFYHAL
jgi:F-box protein 21